MSYRFYCVRIVGEHFSIDQLKLNSRVSQQILYFMFICVWPKRAGGRNEIFIEGIRTYRRHRSDCHPVGFS